MAINITGDSFLYNGVDMYELARLRIIGRDVFTAPLRPRKIHIPNRSGAYDQGAKYHDERTLTLECNIDGEITDRQFDELKYQLSRKGRIILWDKPDRYYYGQAYDFGEVEDFFNHEIRQFDLVFVCDPYAYALEPTVVQTTQNVYQPHYIGTRETPTRITLRNKGTLPMQNIIITTRNRK